MPPVFQVRSFLLSEQEFGSAVEQADDKLELYESLLMDCKDAVNVVKEELRQDPVSDGGGGKTDIGPGCWESRAGDRVRLTFHPGLAFYV